MTAVGHAPASPIDLIVAVIDDPDHDADKGIISAAATVADWFRVPVHILVTDRHQVDRTRTMVQDLGVEVRAVDDVGPYGLAVRIDEVVDANGPLLVVARPHVDAELSGCSPRVSRLLVGRRRARLPTGPLIVPVDGHLGQLALATAAVWARALETEIELVGGESPAAKRRLENMGLSVATAVDSSSSASALGSDDATAIVVESGQPLPQGPAVDATPVLVVAPSANVFAAPAQPPAQMEALAETECLRRLERGNFGRLAYVIDGLPAIVPVNYRTIAGELVIRSEGGGKLAAAEAGTVVCLEIDHVDAESGSGWSVIVRGRLEVIADAALLATAWSDPPRSMLGDTLLDWLRLTPSHVAGRVVTS